MLGKVLQADRHWSIRLQGATWNGQRITEVVARPRISSRCSVYQNACCAGHCRLITPTSVLQETRTTQQCLVRVFRGPAKGSPDSNGMLVPLQGLKGYSLVGGQPQPRNVQKIPRHWCPGESHERGASISRSIRDPGAAFASGRGAPLGYALVVTTGQKKLCASAQHLATECIHACARQSTLNIVLNLIVLPPTGYLSCCVLAHNARVE